MLKQGASMVALASDRDPLVLYIGFKFKFFTA